MTFFGVQYSCLPRHSLFRRFNISIWDKLNLNRPLCPLFPAGIVAAWAQLRQPLTGGIQGRHISLMLFLLQNNPMDSLRLDKWLWAARFYKTRSLAAKNCELGRVLLASQSAKPSREIRRGDRLRVSTEGGVFEIEVLDLSDLRGPASLAQALYRESDQSRQRRAQEAALQKAARDFEVLPQGKPGKHDRRKIIHFRGRD